MQIRAPDRHHHPPTPGACGRPDRLSGRRCQAVPCQSIAAPSALVPVVTRQPVKVLLAWTKMCVSLVEIWRSQIEPDVLLKIPSPSHGTVQHLIAAELEPMLIRSPTRAGSISRLIPQEAQVHRRQVVQEVKSTLQLSGPQSCWSPSVTMLLLVRAAMPRSGCGSIERQPWTSLIARTGDAASSLRSCRSSPASVASLTAYYRATQAAPSTTAPPMSFRNRATATRLNE